MELQGDDTGTCRKVESPSADAQTALIAVMISPDGKITDVNDAMIKVAGRPREMLIGTDFADYCTSPVRARDGYLEAFSKGSITDYPLSIRHQAGRFTDVLYNATLYRDTHGTVLGVFAVARKLARAAPVVLTYVELLSDTRWDGGRIA